MDEKEQILRFVLIEGEENSTKFINVFSQEAEQKMTVALGPATKEEENNIEFSSLCEELEALERRVEMQGMHIQQAKLEED
jgi:hypothetical protein